MTAAPPAPGLTPQEQPPVISQMNPAPASATGTARRLGFALRPRALVLLLAGCLGVLPYFLLHLAPRWPLLFLLCWNAAVLAAAAGELTRLPGALTVTRAFADTPALGCACAISLFLSHPGRRRARIACSDAMHPALAAMPLEGELTVFPRETAELRLAATPLARGDYPLGAIYARIRGPLGLAERWVTAHPAQQVRVYPSAVRSGAEGELPLLYARHMEMERRRLRRRGLGREFQSLRDFQQGDALRDISWPATARRGRLITRQFTAERSQQVWVLLDAGRLSRTTASVRPIPRTQGGGELITTQLDTATDAALLLARSVSALGDKAGLLVYGRDVLQQLPPGSGAAHLRLMADLLAQTASERGEANHLRAASRLQWLQRRRGLVVWITEIAESAGRPEILAAVAELSRSHLVLLLLLEHPELHALAGQAPASPEAVFAATAAREMEQRRRILIASLEQSGALVARTTAAALATDAVREYLAIKARGLL